MTFMQAKVARDVAAALKALVERKEIAGGGILGVAYRGARDAKNAVVGVFNG